MPEFKEHVSHGEQGSAWNAARIVACFAALIALGASLWAALRIGSCGACHGASALIPEIPVAWIGTAFYALLAITITRQKHPRWIALGFFAALGVHTVLLALLVREQVSCAACIMAGGAAMVGAFVNLAARPRPQVYLPLSAFITAGLVTMVGIGAEYLVHTPRETRQFPQSVASQPASAAAGRVKLVLYERDGCKHCLDFEENVLPQLQQALGDTMDVDRQSAAIDMESPTIVVQGKSSRTFTGMTDEKTLEDAIREMQ
ncbi:MAG TPA: hypothetical protein VGN88_03770 [Phycisphaerae bacterium]